MGENIIAMISMTIMLSVESRGSLQFHTLLSRMVFIKGKIE